MSKKSLFQCPVCSKPLYRGIKQYYCRKKHQFDIARRGYVNLLLPHHIGAGVPGDDREMVRSRRDFLNKGFYENFSDRLNEIILSDAPGAGESGFNLLDAGCGEGYYIWRLSELVAASGGREGVNLYGIDVSKPAIHYASGRGRSIYFAVASTYHTPVLSSCMDYILCIFAPKDEGQFRRILKPEGKLVIAAPGPRHLFSLRKELYEEPELIGTRGTAGAGFKLINKVNVTYQIHLKDSVDIVNLLMMTPYWRHVDSQTVEKIGKKDELVTEVDINIKVYQKVN